jgi:hypothetical protein
MISASGCVSKASPLFGDVVGAGAGGIEVAEQGGSLMTHGFLDQGKLPHLRLAERFAKSVGLGLDATLAAGLLEKGSQLGAGELRGEFRGEGGDQDHACGRGTKSST